MIVHILVLVGLVSLTAFLLWLARRAPLTTIEGWKMRGEGPPGTDDVLHAIWLSIAELAPAGFRDGIEIEWVDAIRTPDLPTGKLPDGREVAGTVTLRRPLPWKRITVVVVLRTFREKGPAWKHAKESALAHEIVMHALPMARGEGRNVEHLLHGDVRIRIERWLSPSSLPKSTNASSTA